MSRLIQAAQSTLIAQLEENLATEKRKNATQEKTINKLNVTNTALSKQVRRQASILGYFLKPKVQPTTQEEWLEKVRKARAEIEAENG